MLNWLKRSRKFLIALGTVAAIAAYPAYQLAVGDGTLDGDDFRNIGLAIGGAVLLYFTRNEPLPPAPPPAETRQFRRP